VNPKIKEDKPKKVLQWTYIEPFVRSVQNFAERVLNQPETAQIAADLEALRRTMNTVQHNTTVTKNILEAPISRNSASQSSATTGYRHTRTWAQMTADAPPPPTAASFPSSFEGRSTTKDLSTPDDRRIVIKLTDTALIDHWRTLSPATLRDRVNSHIRATADQNIIAIKIVAAKQLKSGDLAVYASTVAEKESLQGNTRWITPLGAGSKIVTTIYDVIVHGIPIQSIGRSASHSGTHTGRKP